MVIVFDFVLKKKVYSWFSNYYAFKSGESNFNSTELLVDEKKFPVIIKWAGFPGNESRDRMDPQRLRQTGR